MPKAYISATFKDLQQHRRIAHVVVKRFGYDDVAMEYYVAEDERPAAKCLADVAQCDLYIGIFAWRYGYQPEENNPDGLSITEMEYREAVRLEKPRLLFVIDEDADWPMKFADVDRSKIAAFHGRVRKDRLSGTFSTPDTLEARLSAALEKRGEKAIVATGIDAAAYVKFLRRRYNILDLDALTDPKRDEGLELRLQAVFIEQSVREDPPPIELPKETLQILLSREEIHADDLPEGLTEENLLDLRASYAGKPLRQVLEVLSAPENRCVIILGDPGSGKSTLLRYLTLSLIEGTENPKLQPGLRGRLPFLVDLKSYTALRAQKRCETFFDYFDVLSREEQCPANGSSLKEYLDSTQPAVILFDGIDEIFDPAEQETVTRQITALADAYPDMRVIISSRIIGYRRSLFSQAGFRHFTLQDLDEKQVTEFVSQWYTLTLSGRRDEANERVERIQQSFAASPSIRQLAGNPMLLTIMAIIGKHQELPRERWKLYDHAASVLVQHWDVKKHLADKELGDLMDEEDKKELLRRLAFAMQGGKGGLAGNHIHAAELQREFERYLKERYALPPDKAKIIAKEMIAQFRERNFILSFYGANLYGFVHRAFLEFFCADAIRTKFEKTDELSLDALKTEVFGKHWTEKVWHEVLRLICGMVGERFAGEFIAYLTKLDRNTPERTNTTLAIACLSEVRRLDLIEEEARALLQTLCEWLDASERFNSPLITAIENAEFIGNRWPGREMLVPWMLSGTRRGISEWDLGTFVGRVSGGSDRAFRQLLKSSQNVEGSMIAAVSFAIAVGWPDEPATLEALQRLFERDTNEAWLVAEATAEYLGHLAKARDWLFGIAESAFEKVQYPLLAYLYDDPRAHPILVKIAKGGDWPLSFPRLEMLIDRPETQEALIEIAATSQDDLARKQAIAILQRHQIPIPGPSS